MEKLTARQKQEVSALIDQFPRSGLDIHINGSMHDEISPVMRGKGLQGSCSNSSVCASAIFERWKKKNMAAPLKGTPKLLCNAVNWH